jgi:hypothetical protein
MSTRQPRHLVSACAVLATLALMAACSAPRTVDPNEPPTNVVVRIFNADPDILPEAIHVLAPQEGLPCCRIDPGDNRQVAISMQHNALFQFLAVRNSTEQGRITCQWKGGTAPRVTWNGSALACTAWD